MALKKNAHKQNPRPVRSINLVVTNNLWTHQEPWKASPCSPGWSFQSSPLLAACPAGRRWHCSCLNQSIYAARRSPWWIPSSCRWSWCTWRQHRKKIRLGYLGYTGRYTEKNKEGGEKPCFFNINWRHCLLESNVRSFFFSTKVNVKCQFSKI